MPPIKWVPGFFHRDKAARVGSWPLHINAEVISNSELHGSSTRLNSDLHLPSTTLILFQKGVFYSGSRIFNHLPPNNKDLFNNEKWFRSALKKHLLENFRIVWPCIMIDSLWIKSTDALSSNFIIGIITLHVSGSLSAHHQELRSRTTA